MTLCPVQLTYLLTVLPCKCGANLSIFKENKIVFKGHDSLRLDVDLQRGDCRHDGPNH